MKATFSKNKERFLKDYYEYLRFKSIACDPEFTHEVLKCADWVFHYLQGSPLQVEKWETERAPVIFAQDMRAGKGKKTILFYCHYDVQPVDPLQEWISPPFEPTLRGNEVYARGASDNKGQCFYTMLALKTILSEMKHPSVNVKMIIEGGEESGSVGLFSILPHKKQALKADYLVIVDSGLDDPQTPAISLGARGIVTMEIALKEADFDLHSGMTGGAAYNPNRALVELLASLHDNEGKVTVPGFYDDIIPLSQEERKEIHFEFDAQQCKKLFGFHPTGMEKGTPVHDAIWLRPTLEINGMWGGYTGPGFKTVIPAQAHAKLSCRLVPHQNPDTIAKRVTDYLATKSPKQMELTAQVYPGSGKPFRTDPHSPIVTILAQSFTDIFQKPCQKILMGGSIPVAVDLCETAEAEMLLIGLGLPDDHIHSPNEHFGIDRLEKGFLIICRTLELFLK